MSDDRAIPDGHADADPKLSREERLAAKLRENLRRRKAQARAVATEQAGQETGESGRLPKPSRES